MTPCEETRERLDAYLDGTLEMEERRSAARHLEGCGECRQEMALAERLRHAVADLPRSIEPPRDLWPSIEGRLARPLAGVGDLRARRTRYPDWTRWTFLAAAAVVVIGVGLAVRVWDRGPGQPSGPGADLGAHGVVRRAGVAHIAGIDDLETARASLHRALDARRDQLSPATRAVVDRNLAIIDKAAADIASAIAKDPGNRELNRLLVVAYQQEVELLRQAVSLPSGA